MERRTLSIGDVTARLPEPPPAQCADHALFLDFDGTLVEIATVPEAVRAPEGLAGLLRECAAALGGALALISGRPLAFIDRCLDWRAPYAAGIHGLDLRGVPALPVGGAVTAALDELRRRLAATAQDLVRQGLRVEDKGLAIALHYREHPALAAAAIALAEETVAGAAGALAAQPGKMVIEVKPAAAGKGDAVCRFLEHAPFKGRVPIYIGDDLTDEAGFRAAEAAGGFGVRVGEGSETAARYALADVAAVHAWLRARSL
jgi:trehalose 6-phosphate phosphatase